jgi:hypothetical protein
MILISHRGNINGRNHERENSIDYVENALKMGYDVEVDVWFIDNKFYLGHDKPLYEVDVLFLTNQKLWCHAKNLDVLLKMKYHNINYFWHENDEFTLTSKNYIWSYPRKESCENTIVVMPEMFETKINKCLGICSDFIENYKNY